MKYLEEANLICVHNFIHTAFSHRKPVGKT